MLLVVEKGVRGGICDTISRYAKVNNHFAITLLKEHYGKKQVMIDLHYVETTVQRNIYVHCNH